MAELFQDLRAQAGECPDAQFGGGLADGVVGGDADLLLEGAVHREEAAVGAVGQYHHVRAVVEHRSELLFGQAHGLLGELGLGDVDHQTAQEQVPALRDRGDQIANPDYPAVGGEHPVVEAVVASGLAFAHAVVDGVLGVHGVQGPLPEARLQPFAEGIAEQAFGVGRDVGEAVLLEAHFPGDGIQAFHQSPVVLFAVAQFALQLPPATHLAAQAAVHGQQYGDRDQDQQDDGKTVGRHLAPGRTSVEQAADPGGLESLDLLGAEVGEDLVDDPGEDRLSARHGHRQLVAVWRLAADLQAVELELAEVPYAGGEVADEGVGLAGGQRLQGCRYRRQRQQGEVGMLGDQQFVRSIVVDHRDLESVELVDALRHRAVLACQDDDREVQVGPGEAQVLLALRGSHDAGQQVQPTVLGLLQDLRPGLRFDRRRADAQAFLQQADVAGGESLVAALFVAELEWRPGGVHAQADARVLGQPGPFLGRERECVGQPRPAAGQTQEKHGLQTLHEAVSRWTGI